MQRCILRKSVTRVYDLISMHVQYNIATSHSYVYLNTFIVKCYYTMTCFNAIIVIATTSSPHNTMHCGKLVMDWWILSHNFDGY